MISAIERLRALRAGKHPDDGIIGPDTLADTRHDMTVEEAISWIDELGLRYEYEERAGILEYDGGLSREKADIQAIKEIIERMRSCGGI